jgi:hypothetical protein
VGLKNNCVINLGDTILDALGRLKHMGAISEAQSALQTISQHLMTLVLVFVAFTFSNHESMLGSEIGAPCCPSCRWCGCEKCWSD